MKDVEYVYHSKAIHWEPSPIEMINGHNAEEYLTSFVRKHSPGNLDPHADWNSLMYSPAQAISGGAGLLQSLVLYPGDTIELMLENDTVLGPLPFKALYMDGGPTGPLETGGDFYNFFVLGYYPEGFYEEKIKPLLDTKEDEPEDEPEDVNDGGEWTDWEPKVSSGPLPSGWTAVDSAWPSPNLLQAGFDDGTAAVVSGKFGST
ncbi:uncharacterized protein N0V89_006422 [Didymosphaeria variabile]|uniref:CPAF-like PDZ domain-containing protein n=1 Tax=Didymosphaeria variabile TaxID=1932322 RepID=A0A9W8XMG7_9PLEO|nr:uncharacterized protein N0V89_006422 [Didymosphaeria variabile]KAJ4354685.1 hypothetical protein N0V89_006422 [Didymosphaeria variabile]